MDLLIVILVCLAAVQLAVQSAILWVVCRRDRARAAVITKLTDEIVAAKVAMTDGVPPIRPFLRPYDPPSDPPRRQ